jgi:hypothetical protein
MRRLLTESTEVEVVSDTSDELGGNIDPLSTDSGADDSED